MIAETDMAQGEMLIRDIIERLRHDGCGGCAGKVELLISIDPPHRAAADALVLVGAGGPLRASAPWL